MSNGAPGLQSPPPTNPPSSPASSGPPPTPRDDLKESSPTPVSGKLQILRQWVPRGPSTRAQVC